MDKNEFLNFLHQTSKDFKEFLAVKDKFNNDLSGQLIQFILNNNSTVQNNSTQLNALKEASKMCATMAFESIQRTFERQNSGEQYKQSNAIPTLKTREKSQEELNDFLKLIPGSEHKEAAQDHWEDFEYENQTQQFKIDLHNLVKKVIVFHFEEEIMQLDSKNLLYLDEHTYIMATEPFIEKALEFIG